LDLHGFAIYRCFKATLAGALSKRSSTLQWPFIKSCMPRLVDSDMSPYVQHWPQLITPFTPEGHGLNLSEFPFRFHAYSAYMSCWHDWWRWSRPSFFNTPCFPRRGRTLVQLCVGVSETLSLLPRSWGNWKSEVAGIETGNTRAWLPVVNLA
jgi:hypothetical protein